MAKRADQHVVPNKGGGWAVKSGSRQQAAAVFPTKRDAVSAARARARAEGSGLVIRGRDGKVSERRSYAEDSLHKVVRSNRDYMRKHTRALKDLAKR